MEPQQFVKCEENSQETNISHPLNNYVNKVL